MHAVSFRYDIYVDRNNNADGETWNYEFTDGDTIKLSNANGSTSWDLSYGENGELVITDLTLYIVYYCTRGNESMFRHARAALRCPCVRQDADSPSLHAEERISETY